MELMKEYIVLFRYLFSSSEEIALNKIMSLNELSIKNKMKIAQHYRDNVSGRKFLKSLSYNITGDISK